MEIKSSSVWPTCDSGVLREGFSDEMPFSTPYDNPNPWPTCMNVLRKERGITHT